MNTIRGQIKDTEMKNHWKEEKKKHATAQFERANKLFV